MGWIAERQFKRDHAGLRNTCAACGHEGAPTNPLVVADDGMRVHLSHTIDPEDGYYQQEQEG